MRLIHVALGAAFALTACDVTAPQPRRFDSLRVYGRPLFASPEECGAAQASGASFCTQEAIFCPDGRARVRFTETLVAAEYGIRRDTLTLGFAVNQGTPPEMYFRLTSDESAMTAFATSATWSRDYARELGLAGICS